MVMDIGHSVSIQEDNQLGKSAISFSLQQFEGPLDLLLYLIQKAQVNIYDIPISDITNQFLAYLDLAKQMDLDDLTDFYLMASQLLYIKSRMLLPHDDAFENDEELSDPRLELVERLLEYQKFKKYTALLADSNQAGELFIQRRKSQFMLPFEDQELWNEVSIWDLLKTFAALLKTVTPEQVFNVYEEVTTKQKMALMNEFFETRDEITFLDIVVRPQSPMDVICAFLAILEAVKFHMVIIVQHSLFGDILIRKRTDADVFTYDETDNYADDSSKISSFATFPSQKGGDEAINSIQSLDEDVDDEIIELDDDDGNTEDADDIF
jgi:segregation and condensation protein A